MLAIDHVILPARTLDEAASWMLEAHGLASVPGGRHEGHGTWNRIVPLGDAYLELLAVVDPTEAATSPLGRWVLTVADHPPVISGLCLRTDDADAVAARLGLEPVPMTRRRPDGAVLSWRLVGYDLMLSHGLPFFVEWDVSPADHPGRASVQHRVEPTGWMEVTLTGDPATLRRHLGDHDMPVDIVDGPPGVARIRVGTETGAFELVANA
jgi:hypothetical protein